MNQILATNSNKENYTDKNIEEKYDVSDNQFETDGYELSNNDNIANDYSEEPNYFKMDEEYSARSYNSNRTNSVDSKKIIIFFCITIIVFGLAIGGVSAYKMYRNKEIKNATPEVIIEQIEGNAKIAATYKKGISKVIYYWNENEKTDIPSNGESVEKLIDVPKGDNTLTVLLIDSDGNESTYTKEFSYYTDREKPTIELSIVEEDAKLKITATDETEMAYLTYQWNEEEPKTIETEQVGDLTIEKTIDIQRGKNTLKITAVDTSNNETVEEKGFNGVNEPEIELYVQSGYLYMTIKHDIGIKKIEYTINGKAYTFDENSSTYEKEKKLVKRKKALQEGENKVEITAYSLEDTQATLKRKTTYVPSE